MSLGIGYSMKKPSNKSRGRVKTPGQRADGRLGGWKFYSCGVDRLSEADEVTRC
jgi:hypothetical protein